MAAKNKTGLAIGIVVVIVIIIVAVIYFKNQKENKKQGGDANKKEASPDPRTFRTAVMPQP